MKSSSLLTGPLHLTLRLLSSVAQIGLMHPLLVINVVLEVRQMNAAKEKLALDTPRAKPRFLLSLSWGALLLN